MTEGEVRYGSIDIFAKYEKHYTEYIKEGYPNMKKHSEFVRVFMWMIGTEEGYEYLKLLMKD